MKAHREAFSCRYIGVESVVMLLLVVVVVVEEGNWLKSSGR